MMEMVIGFLFWMLLVCNCSNMTCTWSSCRRVRPKLRHDSHGRGVDCCAESDAER